MLSLQEASKLVNDGTFDKDKWFVVYDYTAQNHPWALEIRNKVFSKTKEEMFSTEILHEAQILAENNFPIQEGHILELGAHYGGFAIYKVLTSSVIIEATDASKVITEDTKKHEHSLGLSDRIHRHLMLAEDLKFEDNTFDRVYAFETMEHVGDLDKSLSEIQRVLKPAGDFVFSLPFHNHEDSGFHTQKHSKEYWIGKLSEYFIIDKIIYTQRDMAMVGKVSNMKEVKKNG